MTRTAFALCALLAGCAAQQRSIAYQGATIARQIADDGAAEWKRGVEAQVEHCKATVPKESSTKAQREECLGVFNETDKATKIFEAIVAAQKAVYWALKFGEMGDVRDALSELDGVLQDAKPFLEAARKAR